MVKKSHAHWLKPGLSKIAKLHLLFAVIYVAQIIAYDASKLITPDVLLKRWFAIGGLSLVAIAVWYLSRSHTTKPAYFKLMAWALILADIAFATFNIYTQRGMASRAVALYFIAIAVSAILLSRVALFTTALICAVAYTTAAVAYFVNFFNEGYKIELYGEILFYAGTFFVAAAVLWAAVKTKKHI